MEWARRSEPRTRKVCGPPAYSGVIRPFGALIWLSFGNTSCGELADLVERDRGGRRRRRARRSGAPRAGSASTCSTRASAGARHPSAVGHVSRWLAGMVGALARRRAPPTGPRPGGRRAHSASKGSGPRGVSSRFGGYARAVFSARNRELLGLLPSALLVTGGFTAIFIQTQNNTPHARHEPDAQPRLERVAELRRCCSSACAWRPTW